MAAWGGSRTVSANRDTPSLCEVVIGTMTRHPDRDILTTGEAAAVCGVSRSTLRRAVAQGQLTAWHTPGNHLRFSQRACTEFARGLGRIDLTGRAQHEPEQVRSIHAALEAGG